MVLGPGPVWEVGEPGEPAPRPEWDAEEERTVRDLLGPRGWVVTDARVDGDDLVLLIRRRRPRRRVFGPLRDL